MKRILCALLLAFSASLSQAAIIGSTTSRVTHIIVKADIIHVAISSASYCGAGVIEISQSQANFSTLYAGLLYAMHKQYLVDFMIESCNGTYSRPAEVVIRGPLVQ